MSMREVSTRIVAGTGAGVGISPDPGAPMHGQLSGGQQHESPQTARWAATGSSLVVEIVPLHDAKAVAAANGSICAVLRIRMSVRRMNIDELILSCSLMSRLWPVLAMQRSGRSLVLQSMVGPRSPMIEKGGH